MTDDTDDFEKAVEQRKERAPDNHRTGEHGQYGTTDYGGTCPLCGEEYALTLPDHLPCEDDDMTENGGNADR